MKTLWLLIRLSRPHFLLGGFLMYGLGVCIALYLGKSVDFTIYLLGQAWGTMLQLSTHYLNEYFDAPADADNENRTIFTGGSGAIGPGKLPRATAFWAGMICLAAAATLTVILIRVASPSPATLFIMALIFLGAFLYAVPPVRLESSGYGELTTSILVANLVPAFGLLLQTGEMNRLLAMATFPLTPLHLAMLLAFELPDYANDVKHEKRTLLVRLGWQLGMRLHNILILVSFLLLGLAILQGLPTRIALPTFMVLPLGLLQIFVMSRIESGAKPHWTSLTLTAILLYGLVASLLTYTFFIHSFPL